MAARAPEVRREDEKVREPYYSVQIEITGDDVQFIKQRSNSQVGLASNIPQV